MDSILENADIYKFGYFGIPQKGNSVDFEIDNFTFYNISFINNN